MQELVKFIASSTRCCQSTETDDTDLDIRLTLLNFDRIDEDRLEAWIELVILRRLTGQDDEEIQQQPAGSSPTVVVRSDTEEEKKLPPVPEVLQGDSALRMEYLSFKT